MKRRNYWRPVLTLFVLGTFLVTMLRWFEHNQVYHPGRTLETTGAALGRPFEDVRFESTGGLKLNGWFFPADARSPSASLTVLVCHGNAGNISHRLGLCRILLQAGVNVFAFDYRGYGLSQGRPSEEGTYEDAQAAVRWLQRRGLTDIVAYGESLGGGVASELCLREKSAGLILQSTFTSIPDVGAELFPWLPVHWLARIKYETLRKLPQIRVPLLVMHSRADELIPFHHGERNFATANEPKLFCELKGEHNDPLADGERFRAGLESFLHLIKPQQGTTPEVRVFESR
jgi:fermentation-respiration switch protein FrsA (DUF1100 family)